MSHDLDPGMGCQLTCQLLAAKIERHQGGDVGQLGSQLALSAHSAVARPAIVTWQLPAGRLGLGCFGRSNNRYPCALTAAPQVYKHSVP